MDIESKQYSYGNDDGRVRNRLARHRNVHLNIAWVRAESSDLLESCRNGACRGQQANNCVDGFHSGDSQARRCGNNQMIPVDVITEFIRCLIDSNSGSREQPQICSE